jgi:hypothetical protein
MKKELDEMTCEERQAHHEKMCEMADNRRKEIRENALIQSMMNDELRKLEVLNQTLNFVMDKVFPKGVA